MEVVCVCSVLEVNDEDDSLESVPHHPRIPKIAPIGSSRARIARDRAAKRGATSYHRHSYHR